MGRKDIIRSIVLQSFLKTPDSKLYQCQYCSQQYALNVTRMSNHLSQKCIQCPIKIKLEIEQKTKASVSGSTSKSKDETSTGTAMTIGEVEPDEMPTDSDENSVHSFFSKTLYEYASPRGSLLPTTTNPRNTASLNSAFIDIMTPSEEHKVWELLARACYASNTPLNFTKNVHWNNLFKTINPSLNLPSPYQLSTSLLDREHGRIREQIIEQIKTATTIGVEINGWSDVRRDYIISVIITTPDPVLYKVIDTKTNRHDANYLCSLLSTIVDELGLAKVMTVITDNVSNTEAAWKLLNEKYSSGYFSCYGCCAHILNLLISDILTVEPFSSTAEIGKTIVNSVKGSHNLNTTFTLIQEEQYNLNNSSSTKSLELPSQTPWASISFCMLNKQSLKQLVTTKTVPYVIRSDVKHNILSATFWQNVDIMYHLVEPISEYITKMQTSKLCISEAVEIFFHLNSCFNKTCPSSLLDTVQNFLQARKRMALRPVHFAANLLDPKYIGRHLNSNEYIEALTYINKLSCHLSGSNTGQVMTDVALYKVKEEFFANDFLWTALSSGTLSSVVWWKSLCATTSLSKIATEILNCPAATTSAIKQSFSDFPNNQNRKLTNEAAAKLLFVNCNLKLAKPKTLVQNEKCCTSQESDAFVLQEVVMKTEYDSDCE